MQVSLDENSFRDRTGNRMDGAPLDVGAPIVGDVTDLRPRGAGEDGVPLCNPSPVNAIHDAAGKRARRLPTGDRLVSAQHGAGRRRLADEARPMRLTRYSDYALRVLTYLALNGHRRCTVREIADAYGVSESHLTKVIHHLGRSGFIATVRGAGGGLELARPASGISLGAVYHEFEPGFELAECFADRERCACPIAGYCVMTRVLELALQAFFEVLDRHTLEDLLTTAPTLKHILSAGEVGARGLSTNRATGGPSPARRYWRAHLNR